MPKACIAIRHVLFENLGVFENPIRESGFDIEIRGHQQFPPNPPKLKLKPDWIVSRQRQQRALSLLPKYIVKDGA